MDKDIAISVKNVSKTFRIFHEKVSSIRGAFTSALNGKRTFEEFKALDDVSFEARPKRLAYRCGRACPKCLAYRCGRARPKRLAYRCGRVKKGEFFGIIGLVAPKAFEGRRNGFRNGFSSAFLRILTGRISCAIFEVLKPPVLALWAWRVFVGGFQLLTQRGTLVHL